MDGSVGQEDLTLHYMLRLLVPFFFFKLMKDLQAFVKNVKRPSQPGQSTDVPQELNLACLARHELKMAVSQERQSLGGSAGMNGINCRCEKPQHAHPRRLRALTAASGASKTSSASHFYTSAPALHHISSSSSPFIFVLLLYIKLFICTFLYRTEEAKL